MAGQKNGSGFAFILEMLLVTLFFSLSAAVLIQVFAAARLRADSNIAQNEGLIAAQSALEQTLAEESVATDESVYWYDSNWQPVESGDASAVYTVTVSVAQESRSQAGVLYQITVETVLLENGRELFTPLSSRKFIPVAESEVETP